MLRIAGIVKESITDGRGIRYTVFTQGCPHNCAGCQNPESHSFDGGREKDINTIFREFKKNPLLKGISFSGGEPFCQPGELAELARMVHSTGKDVTVYSGWTYEELLAMEDENVAALLKETDVLVDGKYDEKLRNLELHFRGSENQRLIDMNKTRETGEVQLLQL